MKANIDVPLTPEALPKSVELARLLENTPDGEGEEGVKEKLGLLLESISADIGKQFTPDADQIYKEMKEQDCLARVEQLSRVLEAIELKKPIQISDEDESHYANAVLPVPQGIKIAFSEGQAPGPLRAMVAFGKTIIGFKTDHLSVEEIDFSEGQFITASERKYLCRHVTGQLETEDIKYLVMRIPFSLMQEKHLTEEEQSKKSPFIFRSMRL